MLYVANKKTIKKLERPEPNRRTLSLLLSPELDPTNHDIVVGKTEMIAGCQSDVRGHEEGEMFYCLKGKGTLVAGDENIIMEEGDCVYVPPLMIHQLKADQGEPFDLLWTNTPPFGGDRDFLNLPSGRKEVFPEK